MLVEQMQAPPVVPEGLGLKGELGNRVLGQDLHLLGTLMPDACSLDS